MPSSYLRQTLFALLLAIGQLLLVAHAVEHAAGGEEGLAAAVWLMANYKSYLLLVA